MKYFIDHFNREFKKNTRGVSHAAMQALLEYPWPGNVRELKNLIERVMILENKEIIDVPDLPREILGQEPSRPTEQTFTLPPGGIVLEDVEKSLIEQALKRTGGQPDARRAPPRPHPRHAPVPAQEVRTGVRQG